MAKHRKKYSEAFKKQMVAESRADGATARIVAERHNVPINRIYAWRVDERYQGEEHALGISDFVEVAVEPDRAAVPASSLLERQAERDHRIEITLENGRRISISDGVDAGFVLELARGLAA